MSIIGLDQKITFLSDVLVELDKRSLLPHAARLRTQSGVKREKVSTIRTQELMRFQH
ncbi:hypothetical protein LPAF129_16770 [Ligilactobacillus pabuli]|uniref:Uncharacterized protein n=1 Tax=Ligilactobacillus pabuli TaxID=2886039 RepID=A0ABQ5JJ88_9LACO|nr:hypothetical protein LPAF129_16770 [Ligilactobacillus pabuli]